ncbi:MAG: hypothetical protein Q7J35_03510 [Candidatus Methanoperedens sp.]|nr:hypothetical protein [Candidatus Methanoperedens sp.]
MSTEHEVYNRIMSRQDVWAQQATKPDDKGRYGYFTKKVKLTRKDIDDSMLGNKKTIGAYIVNPDGNTCTNPQIDIDNHDGKTNVREIVLKVFNELKRIGLHPYIEASSGELDQGAHVGEICKPTAAKVCKEVLDNVLRVLDLKGHEVFPKQTEVNPDSFGSLVKLPFQYNNRTKQRSQIINPETLEPFSRQDAINYLMALQDSVFEVKKDIETPIQPVNEAPKASSEDVSFDSAFGLSDIKPCIKACFDEKWVLHGKGDEGHNFRIAIAGNLLYNGATDQHVHDYFMLQSDYSKKTTNKQIKSIKEYLSEGKKPMGCKKIKEKCSTLLNGMCETCENNLIEKKKRNEEPLGRENYRNDKKSFDSYVKATCKLCKYFPDNGYCTKKRTGVKPEKSACNQYAPEGTPDYIEEKEPEAPLHIREKANEVLEKGDPVKYIFDTHQRLHVGDGILTLTRIAAVGNQSVVNTKGIQPSTDGNSGKGKSDGDKKFVHLIPKEYVLSGSVSDKVLYYKKDLKPGTYIYSDDVILSEDLTSTIKRATSNFQQYTPHYTLDKDRNVLENHIPPRIVWGLNSIDNVNSLQLINRQFGCSVDESVEQDENVLLYQKVCGMLGTDELPETDDVLICREIIRNIKKYLFKVIIPFNYLIEWKDASNRRNFDMFEDMIRGFAVFRYRQRERHEDILVAELQDFDDAEKLYGYRTEQQGRKLTDSELKLIHILNEVGIANSKELQELAGLSQGRVSHLINGKGKDSDSGLIHKVKELHTEKRTELTANGNVTKIYYSMTGFDENKYKDRVVWIEAEARKEYLAYYPDITGLLLSKIDNSDLVITNITYITSLHSNNKYNNLLEIIFSGKTEKNIILCKTEKRGNKGNKQTTDSDSTKVIRGNKQGNKHSLLPPKTNKSDNNVTELCGICGKSLNGNSEQGPAGLGHIHPSCKYEMKSIKALVDIPAFVCIDNITRSLKSGEVRNIPAINACGLIMRRAAERLDEGLVA